jgi:hypothetical protein
MLPQLLVVLVDMQNFGRKLYCRPNPELRENPHVHGHDLL